MFSLRLPHSKKYRYAFFAGAALLLLLLAFFIYTLVRPKAGPSMVGKDAGVTLTDYAGKDITFDSYLGLFHNKPLIVFFWATWCPYCNAEFAHLAEIKKQYGDRVQVVAINRRESSFEAKAYTDKLPESGIVYLIDPNDALFNKFGGYAVPETLFINSWGEKVLHKHAPVTSEEIDAGIAQILK